METLHKALEEKINKSVPESTYEHPDKPGEGAKKRKKLKNKKDKFEAVMHEFKMGTLRSGSGEIVTDRKQAIAIAMSESGMSKSIKEVFKERLEKALPEKPSEKEPLPTGASRTPPKGYPKSKREYAIPNEYKYPLDTEKHVRAAMTYFSVAKNKGQYSAEEQKSIWIRINRAAKKFGINISKEVKEREN